MPHVVSLAYTPVGVERRPADRFARVPAERVVLVEGQGIEGDLKGKGGDRQLNLMLAEAVEGLRADGFRTAPGELGEQVVVAGLDAGAVAAGARLRLGAAVIEVTAPRTPCGRFAHVQGQTVKAAWGRIGVMARVVRGGEVAVGDPVGVEPA
jgi:MOSC domain-containing protein YiiM